MEDWQKDWKVIDILELRNGDVALDLEIDKMIEEKPNGSAQLFNIDKGEQEYFPVLIKFLLENNYKMGDYILFWISW